MSLLIIILDCILIFELGYLELFLTYRNLSIVIVEIINTHSYSIANKSLLDECIVRYENLLFTIMDFNRKT